MTPVQRPPVSFRDRDVEARLAERARSDVSRGQTASRDLARYYTLLDRALRQITLSEAEASLICDALNGTLHTAADAHLVWASVEDAIRLDALDKKWKVDGVALVAKLRDVGPCVNVAIADAAERFWLDPNEPGALATVGLTR